MFEKLGTGWNLTKQSLKALKADKEIILFPILSAIITIILTLVFFGLFILTSLTGQAINQSLGAILFYIIIFVYIILTYFITLFFKSAIITSASIRFNGQNPSFSQGLSLPLKKIFKIFLWAIIYGIINSIISVISRAGKGKSRNVQMATQVGGSTLKTIWNLLTFFVLPVILFENVSFFSSFARSKELFVKNWQESIGSRISMGGVFSIIIIIAAIPLLISFFIGISILTIVMLLLFFLCFTIVLVLATSANGILTAALYHYATTGKMPSIYDKELTKSLE
ncbi:MAG: DUF6159 family protein [Candidatus Pacearchaeota archaeon]|jgi:hypothetical protein